jgi:hypothetical protein
VWRREKGKPMGVEYALYDRGRKVYVEIGKKFSWSFQMPAEQIVAFLADAANHEGPLEIHSDSGEQPHEKESGWLFIGDWVHEHDDRCICGLCDPPDWGSNGRELKRDDLPSRPWTEVEIAEWKRAQKARIEAHVEAAGESANAE